MNFRRRCYEALSFIRHFRNYYRYHVHRVARQYTSGPPGNAIFVDRDKYIVPPLSSSVTHAVWLQHSAFSGHKEDQMFRRLRAGCKTFVDLGCAEGYYSALFAATADRPGRIAAIDLSPAMIKLHEEVAAANRSLTDNAIEWSIHQLAITDVPGTAHLAEFGPNLTTWYDTDGSRPVEKTTLRDFLRAVQLVPDLIKIDIESYEYEVITSSIDWLVQNRPRLHLELHSQMMRDRGKSPDNFMDLVSKYYMVVDSDPKNYHAATISRLSLVPMARLVQS
jgi:FkbM family methyltransferase